MFSVPQKYESRKDAQKAQMFLPWFLRFLCLFVAENRNAHSQAVI
jgi:hypothetical protein